MRNNYRTLVAATLLGASAMLQSCRNKDYIIPPAPGTIIISATGIGIPSNKFDDYEKKRMQKYNDYLRDEYDTLLKTKNIPEEKRPLYTKEFKDSHDSDCQNPIICEIRYLHSSISELEKFANIQNSELERKSYNQYMEEEYKNLLMRKRIPKNMRKIFTPKVEDSSLYSTGIPNNYNGTLLHKSSCLSYLLYELEKLEDEKE